MSQPETPPVTALRYNGEGTDYVLEARSCWLEVEGLVLYLRKEDDLLIIEAYPNQEGELGDLIAELRLKNERRPSEPKAD